MDMHLEIKSGDVYNLKIKATLSGVAFLLIPINFSHHF
jgi:hypothetical protein